MLLGSVHPKLGKVKKELIFSITYLQDWKQRIKQKQALAVPITSQRAISHGIVVWHDQTEKSRSKLIKYCRSNERPLGTYFVEGFNSLPHAVVLAVFQTWPTNDHVMPGLVLQKLFLFVDPSAVSGITFLNTNLLLGWDITRRTTWHLNGTKETQEEDLKT